MCQFPVKVLKVGETSIQLELVHIAQGDIFDGEPVRKATTIINIRFLNCCFSGSNEPLQTLVVAPLTPERLKYPRQVIVRHVGEAFAASVWPGIVSAMELMLGELQNQTA